MKSFQMISVVIALIVAFSLETQCGKVNKYFGCTYLIFILFVCKGAYEPLSAKNTLYNVMKFNVTILLKILI